MELGTGVFLSAVLLGTVALFIATKDRWNWKKIFLWPLGIVVALSVIGGAIAYAYKQYEERPQKETMLWGVSLGSNMADVRFAKGEPSQRLEENTWRYLLGADTRDDGSYVIKFKDGKVRAVLYDGSRLHAPTISGISSYIGMKDLAEKLGQAAYVSRSKDELRRWYSFEPFNIAAMVEKNEIVVFGIYDPAAGPIEFNDKTEHGTKFGAMNEREELEFLRRLAKEKAAGKSGQRQ